MPELVVSNEGERFLLARCLKPGSADVDDLVAHLYANDYTPTKAWTLANLTELALSGYTPESLAEADWSAPATTAGAAFSQWGTGGVIFTVSSGAAFVYGYFITNQAGDVGVWAQRLGAPFLISAGTPFVMTPQLSGRSQSEPD